MLLAPHPAGHLATATIAVSAILLIAYFISLAIVLVFGLHRCSLAWRFLRARRQKQKANSGRLAPRPLGERAEREGVKTPERTNAHLRQCLPHITVQIPLFNESAVAARVIDAVCQLDYPRELLQVQVLDDSTDNCVDIAAARVALWRERGIGITVIHRDHRDGFKAGALAHALPSAKGSFIAVFDADFVPPRDFLHRMLPPFADPNVGMVQARWSHLNRNASALTRAEAVLLDGHFIIEHAARHQSGCWFNFNGTAGLWRREALESPGIQWEGDTLTEDLDISYRAQLAGWKFVYLNDVACPAELPADFAAFKSQQHRWSMGTAQVARKLLGRVLASPSPLRVKIEAFFHLTCPFASLAVLVLTTALMPMLAISHDIPFGVAIGLAPLLLALLSTCGYYTLSQRVQQRRWRDLCIDLPLTMMLGVGMTVTSARAVLAALLRVKAPFVRTPKSASQNTGDADSGPLSPSPLGERAGVRGRAVDMRPQQNQESQAETRRDHNSDSARKLQEIFALALHREAPSPHPLPQRTGGEGAERSARVVPFDPSLLRLPIRELLFALVETTFALYAALAALHLSTAHGLSPGLPFLVLMSAGFLWVGAGTVISHLRISRFRRSTKHGLNHPLVTTDTTVTPTSPRVSGAVEITVSE